MTIKLRFVNQDDITPNLWHFQLYGPDTVDGTVRIARTSQTLLATETPEDWLAVNLATAQALVDAGETAGAFTAKEEARNFIDTYPNALQLIELGPDALITAIENRTAGQETLLLETLSFAVRLLYAQLKEQ